MTATADLPVECHVIDADIDVTEIGLAENVVRRPMHPADQFEAIAALITKGASVADVAARFGVFESIVTARKKLGRVSPKLLDAYCAGAMSLEPVQAFAVSDIRVGIAINGRTCPYSLHWMEGLQHKMIATQPKLSASGIAIIHAVPTLSATQTVAGWGLSKSEKGSRSARSQSNRHGLHRSRNPSQDRKSGI